jgi:hexosaminidase
MLALAEVLWTPKAKRDEADFIRRLENEFPKLEAMKVNASKSLYQVSIRPEQGPKPGSIAVGMTLATGGSFSMTAMQPPFDESTAQLGVYTGPVIIDSDHELHGWLQREGLTGPIAKRRFLFNKATAQKITLSTPPNERYNEGGAFTLVDGITAQEKRVNTEWLGWKEGVTITVDLGSEQDVREVSIGALNETHSWIHLPERVDISISADGKTFMQVGSSESKAGPGRNAFSLGKVGKARYVRIHVQHLGKIPDGFPGAGNPAWLFLDEIEVR